MDDFNRKFVYPIRYRQEVEEYSKEFGVDKHLVYSIIKTESKFDKDAVSNKGAKGLMQVTDKTASWAAKELKLGSSINIFEPKTNIRIGVWYLSRLEREFHGNIDLSIAAYNGGSGNVRKWLNKDEYSKDGQSLMKIPFKETSDYTYRVMRNYKIYKKLYD
nr:lytic transglycosylase domain-containing protein [Peptostreptococcus anaerobius]